MLKGYLLDDRYEIIQTIGGGGMANVYLANDLILNREVAIKVLRMEYANDPEFIERFDREAKAATSVSHPNIVNIYDVGEEREDHILYMAMEYIDGMTLKEYIQQHSPIDVEETIEIMKQLTSAISHAHANGLIHRDVKPQNILIDKKGNVKITDFGIAMALSATSLTQTNSILGSVQYISPEQARGGKATKKSDIYSLGIVMFELLTGQLPFSGQSPVAIALKHLQEDTPSIRDLDEAIPQSVENIVLRSTTKNPLHRYQTADEMGEALDHALDESVINEPKFTPPIEAGDETKVIPVIDEKMLAQYETEIDKEATILPQTEADQLAQTIVPKKDEGIQQEEPKKKKSIFKRKSFYIITLILLLLVSAVTVYFLFFKVKDVRIPDLTGYEEDEATDILEQLKFKVKTEQTYSDEFDDGIVVKTRPGKDRMIKEGSTVTLVISQGKTTEPFDDYTGKTFSQVERLLNQRGYQDVLAWEVHSDKPAGQIVTQVQPQPGEDVIPNDTVVIFEVSIGPEKTTVPNVENESIDVAKSMIEEKGLKVSIEEAYDDDVGEGKVISQSPKANTEVEKNTTINLNVSKGREAVPPMNETVEFMISFSPTEDEDGELQEKQTVTIYIQDMNHSINEVFEEISISSDAKFEIPLVIAEGETGIIRVLRDQEEIIYNTYPFKGAD